MSATLAEVQQSIRQQLKNSEWYGQDRQTDIVHAAIGIGGESGELLDLIKKDVFRGKKHSRDQWISELGDILWYLVAEAELIGSSMDEVWQYNCHKLDDRRKNGKNGQSWEG